MSGSFFAYNLLDLSEGALDGWGFSIDTIETELLQNSLGDFTFLGDVFIPVFDEGDEIAYNALLGSDGDGGTSFTLALDVVGEYNVPFLGDVSMKLFEDSKAGVRATSRGGFEPFLSASGQIDIELGGEVLGVSIPDVTIPGIKFQDFKLNDLEMRATQAAGMATAGMDRMSFGVFDWAGVDLGAITGALNQAMDAADAVSNPQSALGGAKKEKKINGKPFSIEEIKFESVKDGDDDLKRLKLQVVVNMTKGEGGISGDLNFGIRGKVDYAKLISLTPWDALTYHSLEVGEVEIEARFGPVEFGGALNIFDSHETYGTGFKGGLNIVLKMGGSERGMAAMGQFGTSPEGYDYFFVDLRTKFSPGFTMGSFRIVGMGGGLYYNMTKSVSTQAPAYGERNPVVNSTAGESFSGATYLPRSGSVGLAISTAMELAGSAETFQGDLELTMEFGAESGVRKILFDGDGYFFVKNKKKKNEASLKANLAMELNFELGFISAQFAYELRAPYKNPILVGGNLQGQPQGALMVDINPYDDNEYSNYFYFGKPRRPADVALKIGPLELGVDAYVMMGSNLPDPIPLREIHPAFNGFPDVSRSQGNSFGIAFGVMLKSKGDAEAGPIKINWDVVAGVDASLRKYAGVTCSNTGGEIGIEGWYVKGRAYTHIHAGVKLHVQLDFGLFEIDEKVTLADLSVTATLVAELPNPTYIGGKIKVSGSALGFSVTKSMSVEIGEKCQMNEPYDPSAVVASIKVIEDVFPEEDSEDAEAYDIFGEPAAAFGFSLSMTQTLPANTDGMIVVPDEDNEYVTTSYYPYLKEIYITENGKGRIPVKYQWSEEDKVVKLVTSEVLTAEADHTFFVRVRWRSKRTDEGWRDLKNNKGEYVDEIKTIPFKTGGFPKTMNVAMLDADRHFPGNGQRNWHTGFAPGEIFFKKSGMDQLFASEYTREIEGYEPRTQLVDYMIRLTNLETNETKRIPITERPGSVTLEQLEEKSYSLEVQIDKDNSTTISYKKNVLTSYASKSIKFSTINEDDLLEKTTMYRFEILRVPQPTEEDEAEQATFSEAVASAGQDGVIIRSTSASLNTATDPYSIPDVIYEFVFRTSKYDNLAQKVEQLRIASTLRGPAKVGIDHPIFASSQDIADQYNYTVAYQLLNNNVSIADKYYLFRVDEGFDWWDRQRLKVNLKVDESDTPNYYTTSSGRDHLEMNNLVIGNRASNYQPFMRAALDIDYINSHDGVWYDIVFPEPPRGERLPRLTKAEIESGRAEEANLYKGKSTDGRITVNSKWDVGVAYKGKRVVATQRSAMWMSYAHYAQMFEINFRTPGSTFLPTRILVGLLYGSQGPRAVQNKTYRIERRFNPYPGPDAQNAVGFMTLLYPTDYRGMATKPEFNAIASRWGSFSSRPGNYPDYDAPLRYYHKDFYNSLYEEVAEGDVVEKTLPNVQQ